MKTLTTLRSHCLKGIKLNFPKMYKMSKHCPLNCDNEEAQCEDTQTHMLKCKKLDGETKVDIDNMYSVNVMEQAKIAKVFAKLKKNIWPCPSGQLRQTTKNFDSNLKISKAVKQKRKKST